MSRIDMTFPHPLPPDIARQRVDALLDDLRARSPYFEGVTPEWSPDGASCRFEGDGFQGAVSLTPGQVRVEMRLEGLMAAFRPVVEQKLRELVAKGLGGVAVTS